MRFLNPQKSASLLLAGAAMIAFQMAAVQKAYAHYPIVSAATPACVGGTIVINFTITSWNVGSMTAPGAGENGNVEVFFNGVQVGSGMFVDPTDSFMGSASAPAGTTSVLVSALAVDTWGDGNPGNENSNDEGTSKTVDLTTVSPAHPHLETDASPVAEKL